LLKPYPEKASNKKLINKKVKAIFDSEIPKILIKNGVPISKIAVDQKNIKDT
jgi:hypothetical protein